VPDNLKAAVIRSVLSINIETALNHSEHDQTRQYSFKVDPIATRSPRRKARWNLSTAVRAFGNISACGHRPLGRHLYR